jgi:hypothetical protein
MLRVSYVAQYRLYQFNSGLSEAAAKELGNAGMVGAISGDATATFSPSLGEPAVSAPVARRRLEIAAVESKQILGPDGTIWEHIEGWPDNRTYPNGSEIPHRRGMVRPVVWRTYWLISDLAWHDQPQRARVANPYGTDPGYQPRRQLVRNNDPPADWSVYYQSVVWAQIEANAASNYPGIVL